jgi:hypothetical protein
MEKNNLVYCIFYKDTLDTVYSNINYAMNHIANKKNSVIKPKLLNSNLNFETIFFNYETNNFYNKKQFFYLDHPHITINNLEETTNNEEKIKDEFMENKVIKTNSDYENSNSPSDGTLNLFIPLGNDQDDEYYNIQDKIEETDNTKLSKNELLDKLRQKISNLKNLKEIEENDLSKIETMMENKKENFQKNQIKFNKMIKIKNDKKEKLECLERKYKSDKNTYFKMKIDIDEKNLNEVPELFKIKYDILSEMEEKNELNMENSLQIYLQKIPYIQEVYTIEDEQLIGIFGEYYLEKDIQSSEENSNEDSDSEYFDTEDG